MFFKAKYGNKNPGVHCFPLLFCFPLIVKNGTSKLIKAFLMVEKNYPKLFLDCQMQKRNFQQVNPFKDALPYCLTPVILD